MEWKHLFLACQIHTLNMLPSLLDSFKSFTTSISNHNNNITHNHMTISSPNPTRFIEDALFCSDPFALSYSDPDQKWIIRQHLLSLLHDFPSFKPSVAVFTHNDGTDVKLLRATGNLPVSPSPHAPPVPLTIWLHELYPHMPPIVYVNVADCPHPIYEHYPFADPSSGAADATAYIVNWHFARSSLSGLAHNLVKLFSHNHPFYYTGGGSGRWSHPSFASRMEATDRLASSLYYDSAAITAETGEEIENLAAVQARLRERSEKAAAVVSELERERSRLRSRSDELYEEADKLVNWLKVNAAANSRCAAADDAFEGSEAAMDAMAGDLAAEDLMYVLDEAVGVGILSFDVYLKQVRILARDQFSHRYKMEIIRISEAFPNRVH